MDNSARHPHKHPDANRRGHRFRVGSKLTALLSSFFPTLEENQTKPNQTTPYPTASVGGAKSGEMKTPLPAPEPGMRWHTPDGSVPDRGRQNPPPQGCTTLPTLAQPTEGASGETKPKTDHGPYPTDRRLPSRDSVAPLSKGASAL